MPDDIRSNWQVRQDAWATWRQVILHELMQAGSLDYIHPEYVQHYTRLLHSREVIYA